MQPGKSILEIPCTDACHLPNAAPSPIFTCSGTEVSVSSELLGRDVELEQEHCNAKLYCSQLLIADLYRVTHLKSENLPLI